jgi:hypothetical protein
VEAYRLVRYLEDRLTEGSCQPYATAALYVRNISWCSFLLEAEYIYPRAIAQLEGLDKSKEYPMTPSGLETATFRPVAYCPNQPYYRVTPVDSANEISAL